MLRDGIRHGHHRPKIWSRHRIRHGCWRRRSLYWLGGRGSEEGNRGWRRCLSGAGRGDGLSADRTWTCDSGHVGWYGEHALTGAALKLKYIRTHEIGKKWFLRTKKVSPTCGLSTSQVWLLFKKTRISCLFRVLGHLSGNELYLKVMHI